MKQLLKSVGLEVRGRPWLACHLELPRPRHCCLPYVSQPPILCHGVLHFVASIKMVRLAGAATQAIIATLPYVFTMKHCWTGDMPHHEMLKDTCLADALVSDLIVCHAPEVRVLSKQQACNIAWTQETWLTELSPFWLSTSGEKV